MTPSARAALTSALMSTVSARAQAEEAAWLSAAARRRDGALAAPFAAVTRRLGRRPLALSDSESAALVELGLGWPTGLWAVDDAARAALLLSAAERLPQARFSVLIADLYRHGDAREQAAIARCLELLPCPASWLGLARQAARGGIPLVIEALARDNPYPARHFPDQALEHLAREAAALRVPAEEIWALERRRACRRTGALELS